MNFDNFTTCDFCEHKRDCFQDCPGCNDIVIDGVEGQPCVVCSAFARPAQEQEAV